VRRRNQSNNSGKEQTDADRGRYRRRQVDYSKNRITEATLGLLLQLAASCSVVQRREAMFSGAKINTKSAAPCCMSRYARRAAPASSWTASMSRRTCTGCWTRWRISRRDCAAARSPASAFAMW
jgi:hypothetical protein